MSLLGKLTVAQRIDKLPTFMEPKGSQQHATGPPQGTLLNEHVYSDWLL
jgi:hypothetical protein